MIRLMRKKKFAFILGWLSVTGKGYLSTGLVSHMQVLMFDRATDIISRVKTAFFF